MNNTAGKDPCKIVESLDSRCLGVRTCHIHEIQIEIAICRLPVLANAIVNL